MFNHIPIKLGRSNARSVSAFVGLLAFVFTVMLLSASAEAATPPVGSVVSNQATANYTDGSGTVKTATSNIVTTVVAQVAAVALVTDNSKTVAAGTTAYMPHTLTNNGNGADTFKFVITDTGADFSLTGYSLYIDANGDGVPDNSTPLCTGAACTNYTTPNIPANGTFSFVLAEQVPIGAASGQKNTTTIKAQSQFDSNQYSLLNTDTVTVTTGPAFNMTKSIDTSSGFSSPATCLLGTETGCVKVKYTLTYTNNGTAGNLYLKDLIGTGNTVGMLYVPSSAKWSVGAASLTDAAGSENASGIDFQAVSASGTTTIEAVIQNVPTGFTGTVSFNVAILNSALIGTSSTTNTAQYATDTNTTVAAGTPTTLNPTNPSPYQVLNTYSVVVNNSTTDKTVGVTDAIPAAGADPTTDANLVFIEGVTTIAANTAAPGSTVAFDNYVWNTGTSTDSFNISVAAIDAFPPGTAFQLYKADGATPLTDSNADGTADTGPVAAGASYKVVVKAIIPAAACSPSCPTGPFTESVTATSTTDSNKSNKSYDRLSSLTAPTVDLTNLDGGKIASGPGKDLGAYTPGDTTPTSTNAIASGGTTAFPLFIKNSGLSSDNYNLEFSSTTNFTAGTVPSGWSVVFRTNDAGTTDIGGGVYCWNR